MNISSQKLHTVIFIVHAYYRNCQYILCTKNTIQQCCKAFRLGVIAFEANAAVLHGSLKAGELFWAHFSP